MAQLYLFNREISSLFQLLGEQENAISYSVAWSLTKSPSFLNIFLQHVMKKEYDTSDIQILMQRIEKDRGIKDIEIVLDGEFHLIIEAKKGWTLPASDQLDLYSSRASFVQSPCPDKRLIVLSECSRNFAKNRLADQFNGYPVEIFSWKDIHHFANQAKIKSSHAEKRLLDELNLY